METFGKQMFKSRRATDQRFVNLFKVHKAYQSHVQIGFSGFENEAAEMAKTIVVNKLNKVIESDLGIAINKKLS